MATSTDQLVSLYLHAKKRGQAFSNTNPVSSQIFKEDLKNLAEGLKQFEKNEHEPYREKPPSAANPITNPTANPLPSSSGKLNTRASSQTSPMTSQSDPEIEKINELDLLDPRSLELVRQTQRAFNLSSENEALRMLISVGYERIRDHLPRF